MLVLQCQCWVCSASVDVMIGHGYGALQLAAVLVENGCVGCAMGMHVWESGNDGWLALPRCGFSVSPCCKYRCTGCE